MLGFGPGLVTFSSLMQYGVIIQFCVLPMYKDLEDRRPATFAKSLAIGFSFLFVLFGLFAVIGYGTFGPRVNSDVLKDFPGIHDRSKDPNNPDALPSWVYGCASGAKLAMVVVVLGVYPLMMLPMVSPVREYENQLLTASAAQIVRSPIASDALASVSPGEYSAPRPSLLRRLLNPCLERFPHFYSTVAVFGIALSSMLASFKLSDLGPLNAASGAAQASFFVGIFPTLIAMYLLDKDSIGWRVGLIAMTVCSVGLSAMGFVYTDNNNEALDGDACMWRWEGGNHSHNHTGNHSHHNHTGNHSHPHAPSYHTHDESQVWW
jgi:hypothetical protein